MIFGNGGQPATTKRRQSILYDVLSHPSSTASWSQMQSKNMTMRYYLCTYTLLRERDCVLCTHKYQRARQKSLPLKMAMPDSNSTWGPT